MKKLAVTLLASVATVVALIAPANASARHAPPFVPRPAVAHAMSGRVSASPALAPPAPTAPTARLIPALVSAAGRGAAHSPHAGRPRDDSWCIYAYTRFYEETMVRDLACEAAANLPTIWGVSTCMWGMQLPGPDGIMNPIVAFGACMFGIAPSGGPTPPEYSAYQWCHYSGEYACLNAWGGGPWVRTYTGGPETSDTNQDFALLQNQATGYYEIEYVGTGSWAGQCLGDAYDLSGNADVSLDPCGTASGNQGYGTNMDAGTNGCPSGELWIYDYHWNGYLGPPATWVNGSPWYLNKPWSPSTDCFNIDLETTTG
jgi:hypothetical protein